MITKTLYEAYSIASEEGIMQEIQDPLELFEEDKSKIELDETYTKLCKITISVELLEKE